MSPCGPQKPSISVRVKQAQALMMLPWAQVMPNTFITRTQKFGSGGRVSISFGALPSIVFFFPRLFGEEGTWEDRKGIPHLPCTNSINEMHISRPCIIIILVEYEAVPSVLSQFYFHRRLVEEQKWLMDHSSAYDPETSKSCDIIGTVTYNARALVYTYTLIIELIRST